MKKLLPQAIWRYGTVFVIVNSMLGMFIMIPEGIKAIGKFDKGKVTLLFFTSNINSQEPPQHQVDIA